MKKDEWYLKDVVEKLKTISVENATETDKSFLFSVIKDIFNAPFIIRFIFCLKFLFSKRKK